MCRSTKPLPRSVMTWLSQILSNRVLAMKFLRGRISASAMPEGRRFAQCWPLLPWYRSAENISLLRAVRLHDPGRSGVSVERHRRCGRTVMRPVMAIARLCLEIAMDRCCSDGRAADRRWRGMAVLRPCRQATAGGRGAAGPGGRRAAGGHEGCQPVLRVRRPRSRPSNKVELRARVEGFLEKVLFREGQDVKAGELLYQIEKVQFQAQVDQAKANLAVGRGRGDQRPGRI